VQRSLAVVACARIFTQGRVGSLLRGTMNAIGSMAFIYCNISSLFPVILEYGQ
jgi:hypothetical protein